MRTFGADFAAEIARDDAEPFWTAAFAFQNAFGTVYVSDRPVTISGNVHTVIADETSWSQLASVFDRRTLRLDVQAVDLDFSNYPIPTLSSQRFSQILSQNAEATIVELYFNVRRKSDNAVFQEKIFRGVIQGETTWSYERVKLTIVSMYERYLKSNVLRTVDPDIFKFCHDRDKNATVPIAFGNAPTCIGRVVKGRLISDVTAAETNNPSSGTLREITLNWPAFRQRYPTLGASFGGIIVEGIYVEFTDTLHFKLHGVWAVYEGDIRQDFISYDGIYQIDSGAWEGVFIPGDRFLADIDTTRSEIEFTECPTVFDDPRIGVVYCNDVVLDQRDISLGETATYEIGSADSLRGSTIVHYDGYSAGDATPFVLVPPDYSGSPPAGSVVGIVSPFKVPEMLADSKLLKVGIPLNRNGTPPPLHLEVFDVFNPTGTGEGGTWPRSFIEFGAEEHAIPPQDGAFTGGTPYFNATAPSLSARESPISRSGAVFPSEAYAVTSPGSTAFYSGNRVTWFEVNQDLIPGRTYFMVLVCDDGNPDTNFQDATSNYWVVGSMRDADDPIYIVPPAPQRSLRLRARDYFPNAYASDAATSSGAWAPRAGIRALNVKMVYAGGLLNAAPGTDEWVQPILVNRGMIATKLGVFVKQDPQARGSLLVELKAAETTGAERETVGSVSLSSAEIRSRGGWIEDWLDRPELIRPGFYNVHVKVVADETGSAAGITPLGTLNAPSQPLFTSGGDGPFGGVGWLRKPTFGPASPALALGPDGELKTMTIAIRITAALMTKEVAVDDAGFRVGRVTFNTWLPDEWIFTAYLRGLLKSASPNPSRIIQGLLEYAGVPDAEIDTAGSFADTFTALEVPVIYTFDGQLFEQTNWKELLLRLAFECRSVFDWSIDKARLKYTPSRADAAVATIDYADTRARGLVPEITVKRASSDTLINWIDVFYQRDNRVSDRWTKKAHADDPWSLGVYGKREAPDGSGLFKMKLVRRATMAQNLASFYQERFAKPRNRIEAQTFIDDLAIEKDDQVTLSGL